MVTSKTLFHSWHVVTWEYAAFTEAVNHIRKRWPQSIVVSEPFRIDNRVAFPVYLSQAAVDGRKNKLDLTGCIGFVTINEKESSK